MGVVAFIAATFGLALPADAATPVKAVTTTAVGASPNAGVGVAGVLLYASVTPNTAGGTVAFTDGTTVIPGCAARTVNADSASFGYASCVTTFATPGPHTITVTYAGDTTHLGSAGTITLTVTATPDFFQIALGLFYNFLRALNLFGLNPIDVGPTPPP
ncbi:MAG: Ig-like domain-containing protein, partial [Mycobacteriaceae bacterium]